MTLKGPAHWLNRMKNGASGFAGEKGIFSDELEGKHRVKRLLVNTVTG